MTTREDCVRRDARDPLAPLRAQFALDELDRAGVIYLDGNSLGALPRTAIPRVRAAVEAEWGVGLIRSWNSAGWIDLSQRIGDKIATLVGAGPGELIATDSTSINVFKALHAARFVSDRARSRIVSERSNFPTDLYIAETFAREQGMELVTIEDGELTAHLNERTAIVLLTQANFRNGAVHDLAAVTRAAHDAGAIIIWDLAHTAGAMPVDLNGADADFAVGCGYKYLNGGPGAPAFIWAHRRHTALMDRDGWRQPLSGWLGHSAPFTFEPQYEPARGMARFLCGTPPVLSLTALDCGVDTVLAAGDRGGMAAIRQKSLALSYMFIALVEERCADCGFTIVTPRDPNRRGSQISLAHAGDAYAIMQALIGRGVIGDFRAPDILRFGLTPLYTRFIDVWDAVDRLAGVMSSGEWREPRFSVRSAVT